MGSEARAVTVGDMVILVSRQKQESVLSNRLAPGLLAQE